MRKPFVLLLALTPGLIACESPTESNKLEGLNLPLNLSLGAGGLDSISFHLVESADRPCAPYRLQASASLAGNELRIDLKNHVVKPSACWGVLAPARWMHAIPFGPGTEGTYDLSIHLRNQSDHYQMVVEEGSCWLSGVDGDISRIERSPVTRDPSP